MDEKELMKEKFAKSDSNLLFLKILLKVVAIILSIISIIVGIVAIILAGGKLGDAWLGLIFIILVPLFIILLYNICKFVLWVAYDIKCIRNAVNNVDASQNLKDFY